MIGEQLNPIRNELQALVPASPDAYPQHIDLVRGLVLVIRFEARLYRAASFLDDRILGQTTRGAWLAGADVTEATRRIADPRPLHFIFHTGHVGSTLVSRLLDETGAVLSLREPVPLRTLADAHDVLSKPESLLSEQQFGVLLDMLLKLWARGYDGTRACVVKATSSAGRIAGAILRGRPQSRALYLNLRAEPYLATLLGGANSAIDLRGHGPERMRRLQARTSVAPAPLHSLSIGELAALSWLVETMSQQSALREFPDRVLALDFDRLLADVRGGMERVLAHFGLPRDADCLAAVGRSPILQRYSKAPELPFPPGERAGRLEESRRQNRDEIAKGLAWLEHMAKTDDTIGAAISAAGAT
jgi:hypothetical protein